MHSESELYRMLFSVAWKRDRIRTSQTEQSFSCTETEWNQCLEYLTKCGLAHPVLSALRRSELSQLAPRSFVDRLHTIATRNVVHDLRRRETLSRVAAVLRQIGRQGILLKGTALQVLGDPRDELPLRRAPGDIDIYLDPPFGSELRRHLLEDGFVGSASQARTAPHHLAPVLLHGVVVEIHERIMPRFWGLPERKMIAHALPVPELAALSTLSAEGLMLHAGLHASAHLFAYGLKTAWDLLWIQGRFPELDWDRLAAWVQACRLQRAFWVPIQIFSRELMLSFPQQFMRHAPADRRQQKLEAIARDRIFSALEGPFDLNPFSKTWVFLLFHESWIRQLGYLAELSRGSAAEARRNEARTHRASAPQRWRQMAETLAQWRYYQRSR